MRRKGFMAPSMLFLVVIIASGSAAAYPRPSHLGLVTVDSNGVQPQSLSSKQYFFPSMSWDGRFVAFETDRPFSGSDVDLTDDIYVRDVSDGTTELASVTSSGSPAVAGPCSPTTVTVVQGSGRPAISGDGRYVAFHSCSPNLVPGDTNLSNDYFLHDLKKKTTVAISVSHEGVPAGAVDPGEASFSEANYSQTISSDGRFVVFSSEASDVVPDDANDLRDVFVRDMRKGITEKVLPVTSGSESKSVISGDGRFLLAMTGEGPPCLDPKALGCLKIVDLRTGEISPTRAEIGLFNTSGFSISKTGRYIAWVSAEPAQIVPNDSNAAPDIFVLDRATGRRERVNVSSSGEEGRESDGGVSRGSFIQQGFVSQRPTLSPDGRYVSFLSFQDNLVDNDQNKVWKDAFVHDREVGTTSLLSIGADCRQNGVYTLPAIDAVHEARESMTVGRSNIFNTNVQFLPEDDNSASVHDLYLRDVGMPLGSMVDGGSCQVPPKDLICITAQTCIPPGTAISESDHESTGQSLPGEIDLIEVRLAHRPEMADIYVTLELKEMPNVYLRSEGLSPSPARVSNLYGMRFKVGSRTYEVRAAEGLFGLFECGGSRSLCNRVTDLRGGYGTTGERVVFSLPLKEIGLQDGGELRDALAFTGSGSLWTGIARVSDRLLLQ